MPKRWPSKQLKSATNAPTCCTSFSKCSGPCRKTSGYCGAIGMLTHPARLGGGDICARGERAAAGDFGEGLFPVAGEAADVEAIDGDSLTGLADAPCFGRVGQEHVHRLDELADVGVDEAADAVLDHRD